MFTWFKIFNVTEFDATGLVSQTFTFDLEDLGQKDFLVTKGNLYGITYEGTFITVNLLDNNPNVIDGFAVYRDESDDVWWGFPVES